MRSISELGVISNEIRTDIIKMLECAGSGHPGGSLSCADILCVLYFGDVLKHDPKNPEWDERDYFVLAKGHAAPALYATLSRAGYFPNEWLSGLRKLGEPLQGHPDSKKIPGVEISTGSLGQGLSISSGIACGLRLKGLNAHVFTLLGDGECEEGQVWEAAMFAAHQKLSNLVAIVDENGLQIDGRVDDVCSPHSIADKFFSFGWTVYKVDGHDIKALISTLNEIKQSTDPCPKVLCAHTVKGKGVSFMENQVSWHGKAPNKEEAEAALAELKEDLARCMEGM